MSFAISFFVTLSASCSCHLLFYGRWYFMLRFLCNAFANCVVSFIVLEPCKCCAFSCYAIGFVSHATLSVFSILYIALISLALYYTLFRRPNLKPPLAFLPFLSSPFCRYCHDFCWTALMLVINCPCMVFVCHCSLLYLTAFLCFWTFIFFPYFFFPCHIQHSSWTI